MSENRSEPPSIRTVYERIGSHFSETRRYPWADVTEFVAGTSGEVGVDIGCGNGRHTEVIAEVVDRAIGIDLSRTLLGEAVERAADHEFEATFLQGNATALPIERNAIDVGLYIAAIHHLPTRASRIGSLNELERVLGCDGIALVSSWCTAHDRFDREAAFDTTIDWTLPGGETVPRFYHIYDHETFGADIETSNLEAHDTWVSKGNCYATVGSR